MFLLIVQQKLGACDEAVSGVAQRHSGAKRDPRIPIREEHTNTHTKCFIFIFLQIDKSELERDSKD